MRVTPLARRLGSAALVLSLGAGLTACSGDESADSSSATDDSAGDSADDSNGDSAGADAGADDSTEGGAEEPASTSLQEFSAADFYPAVMGALREAETFTFTTTSEAAGQPTTMTGQARFGDDGVEMLASSTGAQAMELILIDQVMYVKSPAMGAGDKYLKIDLSDPNSLFGMLGKATDPEVMFQAMETPKNLELIGEEEVDGVATNHYRITIDPAQYLEAMDFPEAMKDFLPKEMVTEMWVDGDNLPRKFSQTLETPSPGGGKPVPSMTEGTYSDFGADVEIEAPAADEISDQAVPGA